MADRKHVARAALLAGALALSAGPVALADEGDEEAEATAEAQVQALAMEKPEPQQQSEATRTISLSDADTSMMVAMADAQASFDTFWAAYEAAAPDTDRFAVKVGVPTPNGGTDQIWVVDLERSAKGYSGRLGRTPDGMSPGDTAGARISFRAMDVSDWGYAEGNRLRGHYTTRAVIPRMTDAEAKRVTSLLHDSPVPTKGAAQ